MNGQKSMIIYDTYDDYVNNTGDEIEGDYIYTGSSEGMFSDLVNIFKNQDKSSSGEDKIKLTKKKFWGFKLNGVLIRMTESGLQWVALQGKFIYYENGIVKLVNMKSKKKNATWNQGDGAQCGISKDLNAEFIYVPIGLTVSNRHKKDLKNFINANPEYESFHNCVIDKHLHSGEVRKCAERFTNMKVIE